MSERTIQVDAADLGRLLAHALKVGTLTQWSTIAMEFAVAAEDRIAALEKVAEAAEQSIVNKHGIWVGPTVIQTLRAAGYLGEGNE